MMRLPVNIPHATSLTLLFALATAVEVGAQPAPTDTVRPIVRPVTPATPTQPGSAPVVISPVIPPATPAESSAQEAMRTLAPRIQSFSITPSTANSAQITLQLSEGDRAPREFMLQNTERRIDLRAARPGLFTGDVDFDLDTFIKEQEQRAELARRGALVPIFNGRHFVGLEKVKFIDPRSPFHSAC